MNKNVSLIALAFLIAIAGHWSRKKSLNVAMVVGFFFAALFLTVLSEVNEKLAFGLSALFTASVTLAYLPEILTRLGLMNPRSFRQTGETLKQTNRR